MIRSPRWTNALAQTTRSPRNNAKPVVFETAYEATLRKGNSAIPLYTWNDDQCCLPRGATRATLADTKPRSISLAAGDVIVFEEVRDPETGLLKADPDPSRAHAVRLTVATKAVDPVPATPVNVVEIEWGDEDARSRKSAEQS